MSKKNKQNHFFIISFLPALAYWYLESHYDVKTAIIGGAVLAILEITFEKFYFKHVHKISIYNFFLIIFLGFLSLLGDEGIWFKLQPLFTGLIMGSLISIKAYRGSGIMWEMMNEMNAKIPFEKPVFRGLEIRMGLFLLVYGLFMGFVALKFSSGVWLSFKTIGFYVAFFVYFIAEMIFLRKKITQEVLSKT